jgi:hypothetical protein
VRTLTPTCGAVSSRIRPGNGRGTSSNDGERLEQPNPHVRDRIRPSPQVTESGPRTLSRWRHGFKSRWDYERNPTHSSYPGTSTRAAWCAEDRAIGRNSESTVLHRSSATGHRGWNRHGHVEHGNGLVGNEELGIQHQAGRDRNPLPLVPRKLVRIPTDIQLRRGELGSRPSSRATTRERHRLWTFHSSCSRHWSTRAGTSPFHPTRHA